MRLSMAVILGILLTSGIAGAQDLETRELHKEGPFTVRKWVKEGVCKLEISLMKGNQPMGILGLLDGRKYYDELFTTRTGIGKIKDKITVRFDQETPLTVLFQPGSEAQNDNWHWQYLKSSEELLNQVRRRGTMGISFSNGKETFNFTVPLKGSGNAVKALKQCSGSEPAKSDAKVDAKSVAVPAATAAGAVAGGVAGAAVSHANGEKVKADVPGKETKSAAKNVKKQKRSGDKSSRTHRGHEKKRAKKSDRTKKHSDG
ncbi:MAG: hypothetical protein HQL58_02515 [Magnetococcales bacterium]|nr:hypothetical protein [Magnetococcales bacterium]